jgi:hypothetical protein
MKKESHRNNSRWKKNLLWQRRMVAAVDHDHNNTRARIINHTSTGVYSSSSIILQLTRINRATSLTAITAPSYPQIIIVSRWLRDWLNYGYFSYIISAASTSSDFSLTNRSTMHSTCCHPPSSHEHQHMSPLMLLMLMLVLHPHVLFNFICLWWFCNRPHLCQSLFHSEDLSSTCSCAKEEKMR